MAEDIKIQETTKQNQSAKIKAFRGLVLFISAALIAVYYMFGNRLWYVFGSLMVLAAMLPFVLGFEKKAYSARELVMLSIIIALSVVSRMIFAPVPHFKPTAGIVMIAGMAFGPCQGFVAGMLSMLISNFIFGHGPWTLWQMFAFGLAGFLMGVLYEMGIIGEKRIIVSAIIGFFIVLVLVGPILDTSTFFMTQKMLGNQTVKVVYLAGLPVNAVHGVATAITLALLMKPLLERINRVKVKYGM